MRRSVYRLVTPASQAGDGGDQWIYSNEASAQSLRAFRKSAFIAGRQFTTSALEQRRPYAKLVILAIRHQAD